MNHKHIEERCPGAIFLGKAKLKNFKLVFDGFSSVLDCAVANIVPEKGKTVYGGLFEITKDHFKSLDKYENYPVMYKRKKFDCFYNGKIVKGTAYFRASQGKGRPSKAYLKIILDGAGDCGLSKDYIKSILRG